MMNRSFRNEGTFLKKKKPDTDVSGKFFIMVPTAGLEPATY
jgi:hypothetical protein